MNGWRSDKGWADGYLPEIKRILGEHLISDAPAIEDRTRNTDLIVGDRELVLASKRVAVRVRRAAYLGYSHQYTIRSVRYSDNETELSKIIRGRGDYFFYAIAAEDEGTLACWVLINLDEWRLWYFRQVAEGKSGRVKSNLDESSGFIAFDITDLPSPAIVARRSYDHVPAYAGSDFDDLPF